MRGVRIIGGKTGRRWRNWTQIGGILLDRLQLLGTMHTERMREYETVKMQYETQKRMREGR